MNNAVEIRTTNNAVNIGLWKPITTYKFTYVCVSVCLHVCILYLCFIHQVEGLLRLAVITHRSHLIIVTIQLWGVTTSSLCTPYTYLFLGGPCLFSAITVTALVSIILISVYWRMFVFAYCLLTDLFWSLSSTWTAMITSKSCFGPMKADLNIVSRLSSASLPMRCVYEDLPGIPVFCIRPKCWYHWYSETLSLQRKIFNSSLISSILLRSRKEYSETSV